MAHAGVGQLQGGGVAAGAGFNRLAHLMAIGIVIVAELIYVQKFSVGKGSIILLPLLYAFVLGMMCNPAVNPLAGRWVSRDVSATLSQVIIIAVLPLVAKLATLLGPQFQAIVAAGPVLIFHELGNVATALVAMPVAVLLFRMGREAVGATFSIDREPNIAVISERYGLRSPEGMGALSVYAIGTMFGTIFFSLIVPVVHSWNLFSDKALAIACGVGSGSMMAACAGTLITALPEQKDTLMALAAASNLLTTTTGVLFGIYVALPFANKLYALLSRLRAPRPQAAIRMDAADAELLKSEEPELGLGAFAANLLMAGAIIVLSHLIGPKKELAAVLPGVAMVLGICFASCLLNRWLPLKIPTLIWLSILGVLASLPGLPGGEWRNQCFSQVDVLACATLVLAYAGLAVTRREAGIFKRDGLRLLVIAILVFSGTFLGSALVSDILFLLKFGH
ncbi:DUF3100 domain-containing protein [Chromobacterium vaccinii]|uniref:DUF3100 domain-containing protein n=1 Tax=Chromobacterium vaccinii TaxID=1108595 RepID=UPI001E437AFE|nr:DUF3100 domain-containing protein [Chromobacterium vaccinii]MCD4498697.1 DUF3100 domain-containing protein [Chromobacterium vaccinii]